MAKKKKAEKSVFDELSSKYGDKIFKTGEQLLEIEPKVVSVSPKVDVGLGGGIPEGSFVLLTGDAKVGKTVTCLQIAKNCQKDGRNIYFLNIEGRLKQRDLKGILGLDANSVNIIGSFRDEEDGKILTAEEWLAIAEHFIHSDPGCCVILDSISQLATEKELTAKLGEQLRAPAPVLLAQWTKRMMPVINVNRCIVLGIRHLIANTSGFGPAKSASGGRKVQYAVDVDLWCEYTEKWDSGPADNPNQVGQIIHWKTGSTGTNVPPNRKFTSYLRYGIGIDEAYELMMMAKDFLLIRTSGAWHYLDFLADHYEELGLEEWDEEAQKKYKVQGEDNLYHYLKDNPQIWKILEKEVRSIAT